ncbi:mechanosensitive ion channel protein 1 mitochondrial [Phtheirospermum japonicum]|uniref:Mechanosensitive ion channel protein 1 mitochondrial n=1 Tax=Phtheirospermum japonicum TaxID=374723 RepID=A0A830C878_9LAMI|nr:mechanosensitive ion channel protein 1 mitochondrial [Phtheirospermum japonicum]
MAAMRLSRLNLFCSSLKSASRFDLRPSAAYTTKCYLPREPNNAPRFEHNGFRMSGNLGPTFSSRLLGNSGFRGSLSFAGFTPSMNHRLFSSASEAKGSSIARGTEVIADSAASGAGNVGAGGPDDWAGKFKDVWQSTVEAVKYTGEKAKEASDEAAPYVHQLLDTHPYLRDVIVPVGGTLAGTLLAWSLLPRFFRRFHKYSVQGPGALLAGSSIWGPVPYEKSFWGALEAPVRYFITFMAFLEIGQMVAPTVIASQYVTQAWGGAIVVSLVWFLHRWKTNVITRALAAQNIEGAQRDKLLTLDKVSSVGLFVVGSMALAEAFGVAVQSILTVGGIGGVATAFASKDILGNVLSGLTVQISQPFTIGDTIKAGSVEGQVVEMGLTTTSLLTAERFPVVVPNSLFASQVIVNKSRAKWRFMLRKIPLRTEDVDKIPQISEDIKTMLKSNSNVFLEKEPPYCFLSHIERSYAELTLGCNLKRMNKEAEQDILLEAVRIIKGHGAMLGSTLDDNTSSNIN